MFIIKNIEIDGFWGNSKINVDLFEDVNIFIGDNGSGKTTFLNLIESLLSGDVARLATYKFKSIRIQLVEDHHKRSLLVQRFDNSPDILTIKIGTSKFDFNIYNLNSYRREYRMSYPPITYSIKNLREKLNEIIGLSYLSVHRNLVKQDNDVLKDESSANQNPVDSRLSDLMGRLTSYQLQLQSTVNSLSINFQKDILKLMLYNPIYDSVDVKTKIVIDYDKLQRGLNTAYKDLGLLDEDQRQNVSKHLATIKIAADRINKTNENQSPVIYANDVAALTLMKRTERIAELSSKLEQQRNLVFEPINTYIKLITQDFMANKELRFSSSINKGDLVFMQSQREYLPTLLSSGEKQLLILFTEALLQKRARHIFIADEPELSLHISWQRKIVSSLKILNPNSQLILATHSPEIVGKLRKNTINMSDIITNGQ